MKYNNKGTLTYVKRNQVCATHSLSISGGIRLASSSGTLNGGNEGPYVSVVI